ncbi:MAG TPA: hypothetical protein VI796_00865, partial [Candidatus Thermoplasmatota archaeon]|nr:hypothetical protein [Candidatus Thermoplasmatota archaeon]
MRRIVVLAIVLGSGALVWALAAEPGPAGVSHGDLDEAFNLAPGSVRGDGIQPTGAGEPIEVRVTPDGGAIDVYVVDAEWARNLPGDGELDLTRPFSYHAEWSRLHVDRPTEIVLRSDGVTSYTLLLDNSDNYYAGDAVPDLSDGGVVGVELEVRYVDLEHTSLLLGALATLPA